MPQVEIVVRKVLRQRVEQGTVHGRVRGSEVVDRFDGAPPHEVVPDTVDLRAGEEGVVARGYPVGEGLQTVRVRGEHRGIEAGEQRSKHLAGARVPHVAFAVEVDDLFTVDLVLVEAVLSVVLDDAKLHTGKEGGDAG